MTGRTARRRVVRITLPGDAAPPAGASARADLLAAEEPLGIRVGGTALTMTMRTPGDDLELAAGFLVSEGVVHSPADITEIKICDGTSCGHDDHDGMGNIADVTLVPGVTIQPGARRNFLTPSACGICGKTSIADICQIPDAPLSVDQARFAPCVAGGKYARRVEEDYQDAVASGGRGTPWSIIVSKDGKTYPLSGAQPYPTVRQLIELARRRK